MKGSRANDEGIVVGSKFLGCTKKVKKKEIRRRIRIDAKRKF